MYVIMIGCANAHACTHAYAWSKNVYKPLLLYYYIYTVQTRMVLCTTYYRLIINYYLIYI